MDPIYDSIGEGYAATRVADPRITERLTELLDLPKGSRILDVGAGTGNYSFALAEAGYLVTALEPSQVMREQRKNHGGLSWFEGFAESLPFPDASFEGVVMTLCMHHFMDWEIGLAEAVRVTGDGPIVILTFDAYTQSDFWLFDYFPSFLEKDKEWFPKIDDLKTFTRKTLLMNMDVYPFPLPSDLVDHFASAGWARPEVYLNESYRSGISSFASVDEDSVRLGLLKLEQDLNSGEWDSRNGGLRVQMSLDIGYVFVKLAGGERNDCNRIFDEHPS